MNRLQTAYLAYVDLQEARTKLYVHRVIAGSSLPKKKQPFFNRLVTQCLIREQNAAFAYEAAMKKLSEADKQRVLKGEFFPS